MGLADNLRIYQEIINDFEERYYPIISGAVTPFSRFEKMREPQYIYKGDEKIPFNERHPEYQNIFITEFLTV